MACMPVLQEQNRSSQTGEQPANLYPPSPFIPDLDQNSHFKVVSNVEVMGSRSEAQGTTSTACGYPSRLQG